MMFDKRKKIGNLVLILFLLLSLGVSNWLVKRTQELNRQAAGDNAKVLLDPTEISGSVGDEKIVKVVIDTSFNNKKVDFAEANLCYGPEIEIVDLKNDVTVVDTEAFDKEFLKKSIYDSVEMPGKKCLVLSVTNGDRPLDKTKSGVMIMSSIKFKLVKDGETEIVVRPEGGNEVSLFGQSEQIEIATKGVTKVRVGDGSGGGGDVTLDNAEILLESRALSTDKKKLTVSLIVDTKERKPDIVVATVCNTDNLELIADIGVTIPPSSPFTSIIKADLEKEAVDPNLCWSIQVKQEKKADDILSGKQTIVEISYLVKNYGDYKIYFDKKSSLTSVSGVPIVLSDGSKKYKIDLVKYGELTGTLEEGSTVTPTPPVDPGIGSGNVLKFNVLIRGTREKDEENVCAFKWNPVLVTVIDSNGNEKTVNGVLKKTSETREVENDSKELTPVWQVEARLGDDFTTNQSLLVLLKLPKHLQAVFGKDKQIGRFVKQVGTIGGLTADPATTPVFDFTGFRIQPGEVVVENGYEEGWLNVRDFNLIKSAIGLRGDESCYADVNGDGVINAVDTSLFLSELAQKYGDKR